MANALDAIDALGDLLTERLNGEQTTADAKKVRIEFRTEKAPQGEENAFGLDLGIRVIIETPGYSAHRAILVQCKRMFGLGAGGKFSGQYSARTRFDALLVLRFFAAQPARMFADDERTAA